MTPKDRIQIARICVAVAELNQLMGEKDSPNEEETALMAFYQAVDGLREGYGLDKSWTFEEELAASEPS